MAEKVKYISKHAFPERKIAPGDEVTPMSLALSPAEFNYFIRKGSIEVVRGEHETPVYDHHYL
jgi:hypothetical protein